MKHFKAWLLKFALQNKVTGVSFNDDTMEIGITLVTGETLVTKGDRNKWDAEKLLDDMGIEVRERK